MEPDPTFNFKETLATINQAAYAVICHILFDAAVHGMIVAALIGIVGYILKGRNHRFGKPLLAASRKVAIACLVVGIPGVLSFAFTGGLPDTGNYNVHSIGFIVFWCMASIPVIGEEMNYQWFGSSDKPASGTASKSV